MTSLLGRLSARRFGFAAFGLGVLAASGQAPLGWWPLTLLALAGCIALVARGTWQQAAGRAWAAGAGYFAGAVNWIVEPFLVDIARHGWMAPFALLLLAGGLALFWGAAGALAHWLGRGRQSRALAFAVTLAFAELARSHVLTGFPWALVGHVWIGTPVMQLAALTGPHGLSLLAVSIAALPAMARWRGVGLAAALLAAAWGGGMFRLAQPMPADTPVVVRLVQPNAAQHLKWRPDMVPVFFERLMDATARPADPAPDIVIWPETSVPYLLNHADDVMGMMADAAGGGPVMFGAQRRDRQGVYNSLAVIDAQGRVSHLYDKHHLVPFGEYLPFGGVLGAIGLKGLAARDAYGYTPGPGPRLLDLGPAGRVVPLICYEAVFPEDLRAPGGRPDWVVQITNDAWFGRLTGPYQHLAQARLRAVERGLPLVRVANTGVSAVIDARGRVLDSLPLNTAGALDAGLPGALPPTPYARGGDWPAVFAFFLLFALFAAARRQK